MLLEIQERLTATTKQSRSGLLSSICIITTNQDGRATVDLVGNIERDKKTLSDGLVSALSQVEKTGNPNC